MCKYVPSSSGGAVGVVVGVVAMGTVTSAALKHTSHDSHITGIHTYIQVGTINHKVYTSLGVVTQAHSNSLTTHSAPLLAPPRLC